MSGYLSQDRLTWAGLEVPDQIFAEIADAADFSLMCDEDGLLGMAFEVLADSEANTPFTNLVDDGVVPEPIFSFYLADGSSGVLTLGGVDAGHHSGDLHWFSLAEPFYGFWEMPLHHVKVANHASIAAGYTAVMDTVSDTQINNDRHQFFSTTVPNSYHHHQHHHHHHHHHHLREPR